MGIDLAIGIGGAAGQGIATPGDILARIFVRRGLHLKTYSAYQSIVRGGHILLTLFLIFLIIWLFSLAIGVIALLAGSVAVTVVAQTLYTVVAYPLIGITQMILYYDARIRAEGFDIEVMAGSLGAPPVTGVT